MGTASLLQGLRRRNHQIVIPRESGRSSTPRFIDPINDVSGILIDADSEVASGGVLELES
jgi:hypothetical protein